MLNTLSQPPSHLNGFVRHNVPMKLPPDTKSLESCNDCEFLCLEGQLNGTEFILFTYKTV